MTKSFQFTGATKDEVNLFVNGIFQRSIPKAHRFWHKLGVQKAIDAGEVRAHDYKEPMSIEAAYNAKHQDINAWRDAEESRMDMTILSGGIKYDADPVSRTKILGYIATGTVPPYWTSADNVDIRPFTLEMLTAMQNEIHKIGFKLHDRQRELKKELDELKLKEGVTSQEIQALSVGW